MGEKKKILIVEDDFFIRELYQRQLGKEGYSVRVAVDGPAGLLAVNEFKPDLVLLDIMLPGLNGLDLLRTLKSRAETKDVRVILLTNLGQDSVIKESFQLGAEGYLIKTAYTPSQVVKEVKDILEKKTG